jgi:hypothetical protein
MGESDMERPNVERYPSFVSLRAVHNALLKRRRQVGETTEVASQVDAFIRRGQATGALLDNDDDREYSQGLLDYWSAMLHRAGRHPPEATLADFDPLLAPEIPDELCPYLGLDAFDEDDHELFFGREQFTGEIVDLLRTRRLLAVVGSSGSGKSSLVRAGLVPALREGALPGSHAWRYCAPIVPGSDPTASLARLVQSLALSAGEQGESDRFRTERFRQDARHLSRLIDELDLAPAVIVVDQFEELFTLCTGDANRQAFVDSLVYLAQAPGSAHTVILTMRTDFESQIVRLPALHPLLEQSRVYVTAMSAPDLRQVIEGPAERVGLRFEEGVVEALLRDVLGEPAALPLLQFTLLKLWESRERNRITWEAYARLGGGRQALARSADAFYEALIPEEQVTARRILLHMVRPGEGLEVTSNRIPRESLYRTGEARDRIDRVLDRLIREARLVRLTEGDRPVDVQVEVAHEALVRNWPRLVGWLEEERESLRRRQRLTAEARQWERLGRDPKALLRGALLQEALRYEDLGDLEAAFVQASQEAEEQERQRELTQARALAEEQERRAQVEHQRAEDRARTSRYLFGSLLAVVVLLILAVTAASLAIRQTARTNQAAAEANQAATAVSKKAEELRLSEQELAKSVQELRRSEQELAQSIQLLQAQVTADALQVVAVHETATTEASLGQVAAEETLTAVQGEVTEAMQAAQQVVSATLQAALTAQAVSQATAAAAQQTAEAALATPDITQTPTPSPTPTPTPTSTAVPTSTPTPTRTPTPTPSNRFVIEYLGCRSHSSGLGWVKGQVFDADGRPITDGAAKVTIWIDGRLYDSVDNPKPTNSVGWYEWVLGRNQLVRFVKLEVDGRVVPFDPKDFEVPTLSGCFQYVNFRQH